MQPIERFYAKVEKTGSCWFWTASTRGQRQKRGNFYANGKTHDACRWIYAYEHPDAQMSGLVVMHTCDNPLCVNPEHLRLGTQAQNVADMMEKGRSYHQLRPEIELAAAARANEVMAAKPELRPRGERHGLSKLSDTEAASIRRSDERTSILAKRFGLHRTTVQRIRNGNLRALAKDQT